MQLEDISTELLGKRYSDLLYKNTEYRKRIAQKDEAIRYLRQQNEGLKLMLNKQNAQTIQGQQLAMHRKMEQIFEYIQPFYPKVVFGDIFGRSRKTEICECRHLMAHFIKKKYRLSLKTIGSLIGGRDHSSIKNSLEVIEDLCFGDRKFRERLEAIAEKVEKI